MDFSLTNEYAMAQKLFRDFAQNEVAPIAEEVDENHRFPTETVALMQKYGFMGIPFPKSGGVGRVVITLPTRSRLRKSQKFVEPRVLFSRRTHHCAQARLTPTARRNKKTSSCAHWLMAEKSALLVLLNQKPVPMPPDNKPKLYWTVMSGSSMVTRFSSPTVARRKSMSFLQ